MTRLRVIALLAAASLFLYPQPFITATPAARATQCGQERWPVKTLGDSDGVTISKLAPSAATITSLTNLQPPVRAQLQAALATRFGAEKFVYQVDAQIVGYKVEADSDFHIVLADPANSKVTMIAEIPAVACVTGAAAKAQLAGLQQKFTAQIGKPSAKYKKLAKPLSITARGVGFFDFLHGQTGVAPNGFELHPLLGWDLKH